MIGNKELGRYSEVWSYRLEVRVGDNPKWCELSYSPIMPSSSRVWQRMKAEQAKHQETIEFRIRKIKHTMLVEKVVPLTYELPFKSQLKALEN